MIDCLRRGEERRVESHRFAWWMLAAFLLALVLRVGYFAGVEFSVPIRGDILQYVTYAWNLLNHGTFSSAPPGSSAWPPDAIRGPGYPAFLAVWMWLGSDDSSAYLFVAWAQIVVGAACAPLAAVWSAQWLPRAAAIVVGAAVAMWPHAIVFASTLLSETVFAAALLLFLWQTGRAARGDRKSPAAGAGVLGACAALINPVALLLGPIASALLAWRGRRVAAVLLLCAHVAVLSAWSLRNSLHADMPGSGARVAVNLVQGSWPQYHVAWNARHTHPVAAEIMRRIAAEEELMKSDPRAGLAAVARRIRQSPLPYLQWYFVAKPWLLWDWSVAVGWGDVHFLKMPRTPFETQWSFKALHALFRWLNPWIFALSVAGALLAWQRRECDLSGTVAGFARPLAAAALIYVTAVHVVLQAEPRYAVAYRPIQLALAATTVVLLYTKARDLYATRRRTSE